MAKFKRIGAPCIAPDVAGRKIVRIGDVVDAPLSSGWAHDPDWEWVDKNEPAAPAEEQD
jgi:hypothetical protein